MGALFCFPVRRRLAAVTLAWLAGIGLSQWWAFPWRAGLLFCALFAAAGMVCAARRTSALLCFAAAMMIAGNAAAGFQLAVRDEPTPPRTAFSGTVIALESEFRVRLGDVEIGADGEEKRSCARTVVVTLMLEEGEAREGARVGQRISGTGRLFAQDEARNPGEANRRVQAICDGYELSGYLLPGWEAQGEAVFSFSESMRRLRLSLISRIDAVFGEHAPLFEGVMLGERSAMDSEVIGAMRMTGIVHVLTVSGLHLSLIALAISKLLRRLPVGKWARFGLEVTALAFFAALTGAAAGTIRALVMAAMRSLAVCRGRRYDPLTALGAAALGMTAVCPVLALSASFQFSFYTVLGMLLLGHLGARRGGLWSGAAMSVSAQIAAMPMQLLLYGYLPLLALPMNLLGGALVPVIMLGGWMVLGISGIAPALGFAAAKGLGWVSGAFEQASVFAASIEGSVLRLPAPYAPALILFAVWMALCSKRIRFGRARRGAAVLTALLLAATYAPRFCPAARYVQLDVGQGDAALLRVGRQAVLVDVGPKSSYAALRYLRHEGLFVDLVFLSHLDEDHAGALGSLLRSEIGVGGIALPKGAMDEAVSGAVSEAMALAAEMGVPFYEVQRGERIETAAAEFDVLSPDDSLSGDNERSLVLFADVQGMPMLLTGDLPTSGERDDFPDCTLLKVAHHGSKYATSAAFLAQTTPEIAVISVGAGNSYGHPTQRVLEDLQAAGATILRTDESGCITVWPKTGRIGTFCSP
ncbi:MAG: DNA internalization-related competence protein ComEC/Rec2 [Clostridia bacterium]|nr:DNA internalization-related competence protein ComEC/Rec2 [Clostridia bacterium]